MKGKLILNNRAINNSQKRMRMSDCRNFHIIYFITRPSLVAPAIFKFPHYNNIFSVHKVINNDYSHNNEETCTVRVNCNNIVM